MKYSRSNGRVKDNLILPRIESRISEINEESDNLLQETLEFLKGRNKRIQHMYNPYQNYNLYPKNYGDFYNQYPYSMPYYRPIRYFFQRPVQLSPETAFPEQKSKIQKVFSHNREVTKITENKKWGKPIRMEDLIKPAEEVKYPMAKLIFPAEYRKKQEELENLRMEQEKIDPERRRLIRQKNKRIWNLMRKLRHFIKFYSIIKEYSLASKALRKSMEMILQANKSDFSDLTKFIFEKIKGIEELAIDIFPQIFIYDKTLQMKTEDSVFKIKTFVHKIFHELQTSLALKEDIPSYIHKIMLNYLTDGKFFPENFLTTFEFNRLEFDLKLKTSKMNNDRRSMITCFIVLYRILILEIFKNFRKYFKKLSKLKSKEEVRDPNQPDNNLILSQSKKSTINSKKDNVQENINYNMNFIITVLHYILKDCFLNTPKIYREHYKDTHLFKKFVIDGVNFNTIKSIEEKLKKDEIELCNNLVLNSKAEDFVKDNIRWVTMYKMTSFSFCLQFVENILN